ncbi:2OG-Fe dioxygenase family protein [Vibrio neptunius]|uniref:2OG-Fe dioxygenase family protein n=1 Tax=Vibrio neptunius TaxID=170651 RepID=A0ABS3A3B9_9VIBR|nr:2OG-Fe dioxygenase family protein [Vibrio neptunius]MBN3492687.1 2OG-Fe dioxygenase family protein [Vibrio neptunius]MBN3515184.1 2OG-Fe dioxygenase family protein [Vibrio neptunius]MBN3548940.1 2OG-Fe dioxygenase family protein [Vibrio neptunius]MBN3577402.1 2OG-Fe dioxygenase family protein [Vibrio neptunius]MCH9871066.1 2OG-Fe dioxygenase family protein [Vibrio neptunius]
MMLPNRETTLQLTKLSDNAFAQLAPSFTKLPNTEHADGQYRLRRYSVIQFKDGQVIDLQKNEFMQTDDINRFQGNVVRQFEPIEIPTLQSEGMREICQLFVEANKLIDGQEIEIHQMRISAIFDETQVAPEGVHQDGFEHIALIGMGRHNIEGGDVMLYSSFNEAPFFRKVLQNGEVAMLADNKLWHNATPIRSVIEGEEGYMDVFVLTAKEAVNELHS